MFQHTKRQVKYTMRNLIVMFVTAFCFLFLFKRTVLGVPVSQPPPRSHTFLWLLLLGSCSHNAIMCVSK